MPKGYSAVVRRGCVTLLGLLSACAARPDEPCVLLDSDFEQFEGWVRPLPEWLSTEQARSGSYAYRVPDHEEYGGGYVKTLGSMCAFVPQRLRISGWVWLPNGRIRSTKLVVEVKCHGRRPDVWTGLEISQVVKRFQLWEPIEKTIALPADLQPSDELKVYVWHMEKEAEPTYLDDLKVEGWR